MCEISSLTRSNTEKSSQVVLVGRDLVNTQHPPKNKKLPYLYSKGFPDKPPWSTQTPPLTPKNHTNTKPLQTTTPPVNKNKPTTKSPLQTKTNKSLKPSISYNPYKQTNESTSKHFLLSPSPAPRSLHQNPWWWPRCACAPADRYAPRTFGGSRSKSRPPCPWGFKQGEIKGKLLSELLISKAVRMCYVFIDHGFDDFEALKTQVFLIPLGGIWRSVMLLVVKMIQHVWNGCGRMFRGCSTGLFFGYLCHIC